MIRTFALLSLVLAAGSVFADGLYKWVESDGSITFSPNPPPAGVEFERVGTGNDKPPAIAGTTTPGSAKPVQQPAEQASVSSATTSSSVEAVTPPSRLSYAPSDNKRKPGIVKAEPQLDAATESADAVSKGDSDQTSITVAASKQRRCEDLKKRVVSLERRLKVRLSPADMDNTVVHMARYQKSYNQHCLR